MFKPREKLPPLLHQTSLGASGTQSSKQIVPVEEEDAPSRIEENGEGEAGEKIEERVDDRSRKVTHAPEHLRDSIEEKSSKKVKQVPFLERARSMTNLNEGAQGPNGQSNPLVHARGRAQTGVSKGGQPLFTPTSPTPSPKRTTAISSSSDYSFLPKGFKGMSFREKIETVIGRIKPRVWLYICFLVIELMMLGTALGGLAAVNYAAVETFKDVALDGLGSVTAGYTRKIDLFRTGLVALQYAPDVQTILQYGDGISIDQTVTDVLKNFQDVYQVEFATVLDSQMRIVASPNNPRNGVVFNPEGILTAAGENKGVPVWTSAFLTYDELMAEGSPVYRDRLSELQLAAEDQHPYDTRGRSVIRWAALPVYKIDMVNWTVFPNDPYIGYILLGDIVNGKARATSLIANALQHSVGLHVRANTTIASVPGEWQFIAGTSLVTVSQSTAKNKTVSSMLVPGFCPSNIMSNRDWHMDRINARYQADHVRDGNAYIALQPWMGNNQLDSISEVTAVTDGGPRLMLERSVVPEHDSYGTIVVHIVLIVLLDIAVLFTATCLFLSPLELMGKRVKAGGSVDVAFMARLLSRRKYLFVIGAMCLLSLLVGYRVRSIAHDVLINIIYDKSALEPGNMLVAWTTDIDAANDAMAVLAKEKKMLQLLQDPTNTAYLEYSTLRMQRLLLVLQMEFAQLLDANGTIIISGSNGNRAGDYFNPGNVVSDSLSTGNGHTRVALVTWEMLQAEMSPIWNDKLKWATTPNSTLHPSITGKEGILRWMAKPVWATGEPATLETPPDGLLLIGDLVDGKTKMSERTNEVLGSGYSALYHLNLKGEYQIAHSAFTEKNGSFTMDIPLPETSWLDSLRDNTRWREDATVHAHTRATIRGKSLVISARCIEPNKIYTAVGEKIDYTEWDGVTGGCRGFLIHGLPWEQVGFHLTPGFVVTWVFFGVCVLKLFAMAITINTSYTPFRKIVVRNQFVRQHVQKNALARVSRLTRISARLSRMSRISAISRQPSSMGGASRRPSYMPSSPVSGASRRPSNMGAGSPQSRRPSNMPSSAPGSPVSAGRKSVLPR